MTPYSQIEALLNRFILDAENLPRIAWEGVNGEPQPGEPFLSTFFRDCTRTPLVIGGSCSEFSGKYVIEAVIPMGEGTGRLRDIADELVTYYKLGEIYYPDTDQKILIQNAYMMDRYPDNPYLRMPFVVEFSATIQS